MYGFFFNYKTFSAFFSKKISKSPPLHQKTQKTQNLKPNIFHKPRQVYLTNNTALTVTVSAVNNGLFTILLDLRLNRINRNQQRIFKLITCL